MRMSPSIDDDRLDYRYSVINPTCLNSFILDCVRLVAMMCVILLLDTNKARNQRCKY
jgi:hypothetical protein